MAPRFEIRSRKYLAPLLAAQNYWSGTSRYNPSRFSDTCAAWKKDSPDISLADTYPAKDSGYEVLKKSYERSASKVGGF